MEVIVSIAIVSIVFAATISAVVNGYSTILSNKSADDASVEAQGIADTVISTIADVDDPAAINDLVNGTIGAGAYAGLESITGAEYVDRLSFSSAVFPDNSLANPDKQFTIETVSNVQTSKPGTIGKIFNGYKVSVAVLSVEGYITVTAFTAAQ